MLVRLLDPTKTVTIFGQRLSIDKLSIEVSKTAFLNVGRLDGRDTSSDIIDLEILFRHGVIRVEDGSTVITTYEELLQLIDNGYVGSGGGGGPSPYNATPFQVTIAGSAGISLLYSRGDHSHPHGNLPGGTTHALVVAGGSAGYMSGADKTKLDNVPSFVSVANAAAYWDAAGTTLTTDAGLLFGGLDPYSRPQIRDIRQGTGGAANAVWRQGAWQVDGDAQNIEGDGVVVYGRDPTTGLHNGSNGAFARVKSDRFAIRLITGGVDVGYGWRADLTEMYFKDNAGALSFQVVRSSGMGWFRELRITSASGPRVLSGAGDPEGVVVGSPGDLYLNTSGGTGTSVYTKESGVGTNTGWTVVGGTTVPLRLTTAQRIALGYPPDGTLVYDTDERKLYVFQFDIDWPTWSEV